MPLLSLFEVEEHLSRVEAHRFGVVTAIGFELLEKGLELGRV